MFCDMMMQGYTFCINFLIPMEQYVTEGIVKNSTLNVIIYLAMSVLAAVFAQIEHENV